jgi:hypothetical protein
MSSQYFKNQQYKQYDVKAETVIMEPLKNSLSVARRGLAVLLQLLNICFVVVNLKEKILL